MKAKFIVIIPAMMFSILSYGCDSNIAGKEGTEADTTKLPAVETKSGNTDYKPAFKGQTRTAGVKTTTAYKVEKIAQKLGRPWAVTAMPDGRLLTTDKSGFMQIFDANGTLVKKITGFPDVVDRGQIGMLDVALALTS